MKPVPYIVYCVRLRVDLLPVPATVHSYTNRNSGPAASTSTHSASPHALAYEQGYCVIIVTHDPSIAERSDKVWRMSGGVLTGQ